MDQESLKYLDTKFEQLSKKIDEVNEKVLTRTQDLSQHIASCRAYQLFPTNEQVEDYYNIKHKVDGVEKAIMDHSASHQERKEKISDKFFKYWGVIVSTFVLIFLIIKYVVGK